MEVKVIREDLETNTHIGRDADGNLYCKAIGAKEWKLFPQRPTPTVKKEGLPLEYVAMAMNNRLEDRVRWHKMRQLDNT